MLAQKSGNIINMSSVASSIKGSNAFLRVGGGVSTPGPMLQLLPILAFPYIPSICVEVKIELGEEKIYQGSNLK